MKTRRSLLAAALVAGTLGAAHAAEITLYSDADFNGRQMTVQGPVSNVTGAGFNDQTSSIVVHSGRWEVCTAANFQGECVMLRPGEYPRLDATFNDKISSVRQVRGRGQQAGDRGRDNGGALVLFDQRGLRGERLTFDGNVRNLTRQGFNDRAASLLVREGTWQVCAAAEFAGYCETLGPGAYTQLDERLSDRVSSIRRVDGQYGENGQRHGRMQAAVELFAQPGFSGTSFASSHDVESLGGTVFNDRVASMYVNEGRWELCTEAGYRGQCIVVGPGRYEHMGDMTHRLSSIRRVG
jgi:hypothetical protein